VVIKINDWQGSVEIESVVYDDDDDDDDDNDDDDVVVDERGERGNVSFLHKKEMLLLE
jgi:hypothetical protein